MDLLRTEALRLYIFLTISSAIIDSLVTIIGGVAFFMREDLRYLAWVEVILIILWFIETAAKIVSAYYARKLRVHLLAVPGQSVENV